LDIDAALFDGSDPLPIGGLKRLLTARDTPPKVMELAFSANVVNMFAG
jgi:hypothetical protein